MFSPSRTTALVMLLSGAIPLSAEVPAAFETHCFKCHDSVQTDGELDLEGFVLETMGAEQVITLEEIIVRVEEHDMPPKKSRNQPTDGDRAEMIAWARSQIDVLAEAT